MGFLTNLRTGRAIALSARTLVGRGGACTLRIDSRLVSNEHATVWWDDGRWLVRDTGSRNGTWLDGRLLPVGERVAVPTGGTLVFGHAEHTWVLADASPPVAIARAPDGDLRVAAGGVLCLPGPDDPQWMVFEANNGHWVAEGPTGVTRVADGDALAVDGVAFLLHLPAGNTATSAPAELPRAASMATLRFRVSRDEEYVELDLLHPGGAVTLPSRAHAELLLLLARARLEDADDTPAERGWRYADDVQRALGIDKATLNLYVFRARQQFGEAGLVGSAAVVERRIPTGQIRIGVERVEVVGMG